MRSFRTLLLQATGVCFALAITAVAQSGSAPLYSDTADAKADIRDALAQAKQEHKRVILEFGGNWCGDCHVLDIYFHDPSNLHLLNENFELVNVNIGRYDKNLDVAKSYGIPLEKGVPALVVLAPSGKVLYAQTHGEFEKMRQLESSDVTRFLMQWKPAAKTATAAKASL
jgi:thiol:disulfide interchange protein